MQSRLPLPDLEELNAQQCAIRDEIVRARGSIEGPLRAWLHSPELALCAERLGRFCRWGTVLSAAETEVVILVVAAHHDCAIQQQLHEPLARQAGLSEATVAAVRSRLAPPLEDARLAALYQVATQLLATHRIEQPIFDNARQVLGMQALVEALGIIGYYTFVASTCNAFELTLAPDGSNAP